MVPQNAHVLRGDGRRQCGAISVVSSWCYKLAATLQLVALQACAIAYGDVVVGGDYATRGDVAARCD